MGMTSKNVPKIVPMFHNRNQKNKATARLCARSLDFVSRFSQLKVFAMSEFDLNYYNEEASKLALEIERKLLILGLDWQDDSAMRKLALDVLEVNHGGRQIGRSADFSQEQTYEELFGLIGLMNKLMGEAAAKGVLIHGNDAWKAIARAMWAQKEVRDTSV